MILLDEVHVVPAQMFRTTVGIIKAHCRLGLTATLVREDGYIEDLYFLIGPKIHEACWRELSTEGHIAYVVCNEVRCSMTKRFYAEYLKKTENDALRQLLCIMNPNKIRTIQKLLSWHRKE